MKQLIEQNPNRPIVNREIIFLLEDHFRCHILVSPTECFSFHLDVVSSPSQITYLHVAGIVQQYVLGLSNDSCTFISRCIISRLCKYVSAERVWLKNLKVSA